MTKKKQPEPIIISDDNFWDNYKPIINHIVRANTPHTVGDTDICSWAGCMYETYGQELQHILRLTNNKKTQKKVWTIIDGDDGELHIVAGFHIVNRMGYIITQKP